MHHEKDAGDFLHAGYDVEKCAAIAMRHDEIVWDLGNLLEGVFQLHTNSKIYFFDHDPGRTPKKVLSWKKDWICLRTDTSSRYYSLDANPSKVAQRCVCDAMAP